MECRHRTVLVVTPQTDRIRCTRCHLTLSPDEFDDDGCPECFDREGKRYNDFEPVKALDAQPVYRCDECGALLGEG